jgi:hypothetical protein
MKTPRSPWARAIKQKRQMTAEELEGLWRPHPAFVGPVAPPMVLWLRDRQRQEQWEIETNLKPRPEAA